MSTYPPSLLWYDLETWGANPAKDPACQFAAVRTDLALNPIGKPESFFCQISNDYLPHPEAVMVTGISPQQSLRDGMSEAAFMQRIHQQLSQPNTCVVGYNNLRFDDEVLRHSFYRNFYDPYAREWQHNNSRWDLIDIVRACYALRPDGIQWPTREDGSPSFKLEELSKANGLLHADAHEALSDVHATIGLARLVKQAQPKLYDYLFALRDKRKVAEQLNYLQMQPVVHVSSKLPASQGCCTWIVPLAAHPTNKNAIICANLQLDPTPLFELNTEQLREKLYTASADLPPGEQRLPLKLIHINKCPVIAPAKTLSEENAGRLGIDRQACLAHLALLKQQPGLAQKVADIYEQERDLPQPDADHALYSGGFIQNADKVRMQQVRDASAEQLSSLAVEFNDPRLTTLLFRYRARNYPQTLSEQEMQRWQRHRQYRLTEAESGASIILSEFIQRLEVLAEQHANQPEKLALLKALYQYAEQL